MYRLTADRQLGGRKVINRGTGRHEKNKSDGKKGEQGKLDRKRETLGSSWDLMSYYKTYNLTFSQCFYPTQCTFEALKLKAVLLLQWVIVCSCIITYNSLSCYNMHISSVITQFNLSREYAGFSYSYILRLVSPFPVVQ